ncbi:hypothetical protein ACIQMV_08460 [Streptomyces sp. NPDC091412]|uniref:hypothetical protein n=1 Tax=Streptomyces sp. NPDC091412 TaxID=3366002 RepID=UPI0038106C2A
MSLLDIRTRAKHRRKSRSELVKLVGQFEREADKNACKFIEMTTEIEALRADRNHLANRLDEQAVAHTAVVDGLVAERDELRDQLSAMCVKFGPQLAAEANANRVDVPPMERPIDGPEDQATEPIRVITLQEAFGTDPARVPSWARTEPDPAA